MESLRQKTRLLHSINSSPPKFSIISVKFNSYELPPFLTADDACGNGAAEWVQN